MERMEGLTGSAAEAEDEYLVLYTVPGLQLLAANPITGVQDIEISYLQSRQSPDTIHSALGYKPWPVAASNNAVVRVISPTSGDTPTVPTPSKYCTCCSQVSAPHRTYRYAS